MRSIDDRILLLTALIIHDTFKPGHRCRSSILAATLGIFVKCNAIHSFRFGGRSSRQMLMVTGMHWLWYSCSRWFNGSVCRCCRRRFAVFDEHLCVGVGRPFAHACVFFTFSTCVCFCVVVCLLKRWEVRQRNFVKVSAFFFYTVNHIIHQ